MELKLRMKTGKDMRRDYAKRKSKLVGGEPLTDGLANTTKNNSIAPTKFK